MKKYIISLAAIAMAMSTVTVSVAADGDSKYFLDVNSNNYGWAVEYVDYVASNGIASGVGNNMYAPGSNIERGDFAVLVNKTFTFKEAKLETYALKDVSEDSYYAQAIANCYGAKVATDIGMYYPENDITRIDAIVMIYRALQFANCVGGNLSTDTSMFNDSSLLTTVERQAAVGTLHKIGIINGDDTGALNPNSTMTRAEMAVVFTNVDKYVDEYTVYANQKAEEDEVKKAEEEVKKAEEEKEIAKTEESRDYSGETVNETISATSGGTISVDNCYVNVTSKDGISADNESEIDVNKTSTVAIGGNAVIATNDSVIKLNSGSVKGTNGVGVRAESGAEITIDGTKISADGTSPQYAVSANAGNVSIKNTTVSAGDKSGGILVSNGSTLDLDNVTIDATTGTGKATYAGVVDIKSTNDEESVIDIENATITNKTGAAFYVRESDVTINLNGNNNKINTAMLINSPNIVKESQDRGNNITLNLKDGAIIQNTRIVIDPKTVLDINIGDNCSLGGQIDTEVLGYVNIYMEQNATLELNSDLYLDALVDDYNLDFSNIVDNGFNIYYNQDNSENDWLDMKTYDLVLGGQLIPYTKQPITR